MTTAVLAPTRRTREQTRTERPRRVVNQPTRVARSTGAGTNWAPLRRAGVFVVFGLLAIVGTNAMVAASQVNIDQLSGQTRVAETRYQQARIDYAVLASPANVIARAATLGLVSSESPPIAIPVMGTPPQPASKGSPVLDGWNNLKPSLGTRP